MLVFLLARNISNLCLYLKNSSRIFVREYSIADEGQRDMLAFWNCFEIDWEHVRRLRVQKLFSSRSGKRLREGEKKRQLPKCELPRVDKLPFANGNTSALPLEQCFKNFQNLFYYYLDKRYPLIREFIKFSFFLFICRQIYFRLFSSIWISQNVCILNFYCKSWREKERETRISSWISDNSVRRRRARETNQ